MKQRALRRLTGVLVSGVLSAGCVARMTSMPGQSYAGPAASADEALEVALRGDLTQRARGFGERNVENAPDALERAVMVTDTAPFRNPHYHEGTDVPERVDFRRLALTTEGLFAVVEALAQ